EDAWWGEQETFYHYFPTATPDPVAALAEQGVDFFVNLSASPYESEKIGRRHQLIRHHVERHRRPFLFVNQVGGNDDLVFDGNSFVMNDQGEVILAAAGFQSDFRLIDTELINTESWPSAVLFQEASRESQLLDALTLGLGDYMRKCGFTDAVLGLSGGIDSALAACIAARAVGPERVHALLMPSRYSSSHSLEDAQAQAEHVGIDWTIIPIDEVHRTYESLTTIATDLATQPGGLADQNLQARIRGAIVMTRSNRYNWLALTTGNKSELAVGYCTLYGDMCGGFAVLSDLYKQDVYALSREINRQAGREIIPARVLEKAPSAELAPDQFDQDTLPPYPLLDAILQGLIDDQLSPAELAKRFPEETVRWVVTRLDRNEFKRRQMPPGVKLNDRAFGTGRRMPMAAKSFTGLEIITGSETPPQTTEDHRPKMN
ncbi:MAG TPA: NAD(+) synthase, partial [Planctomicrobium sp.]|nr:NAD(+) synthase [Planctomicrobium sp.]